MCQVIGCGQFIDKSTRLDDAQTANAVASHNAAADRPAREATSNPPPARVGPGHDPTSRSMNGIDGEVALCPPTPERLDNGMSERH